MTTAPPRRSSPAEAGDPGDVDAPATAVRVLLVEDHDDTRQMYALFLRHCGYEVLEARDGVEAERVCHARPPQVIVMDLALPDLDGFELTRRFKASPDLRHIPVVALTGHALAEHERDAREAGCARFLIKPCLPDALAEEIQQLLGPPESTGG